LYETNIGHFHAAGKRLEKSSTAVSSILGHIPTMDEYMQFAADLDPMATDVYRYLNFDEIESFQKSASQANSKLESIPVSVVN
jgi:hypothetical protein